MCSLELQKVCFQDATV
uniref:Uncharacterized protein n=1 Tax=Anguilla anguilla TaxID=7936 RepID=A0A0E9RXU5_ANGAN